MGEVTPDHFVTVEVEVPDPGPGQVLVHNTFTSVDPGMRLRLRKSGPAGYFNSFPLNASMDDIWAVGEVIESRAEGFEPGDCVWHAKGWRDYAIVTAGEPALAGIATLARLDTSVAPPESYLGPLGAMGVTAYARADRRRGRLTRGGTSSGVSAAAGAVGSLAAQIARLRGHWVIGSAGPEEKVRYLLDELGLHAAFNYRDGPVVDRLREAAPDGIDVYFDNVGGDHLEAALATLRGWGRVALCGAISEYESVAPTAGPRNLFQATANNLTLRGFRGSAYQHRLPDVVRDLGGWLARRPAPVSRDRYRRPGAGARGAHAGAVREYHGQGPRPDRLARRGAAIMRRGAQRAARVRVWQGPKERHHNRPPPGTAPRRTRGSRPATGRRSAGTSARRSCITRARRAWRPRIRLGDRALLHPGEECRPGKLDVAHARAGEPACLFLARRLARDRDQPLLRDQDAVTQYLVLGEIEQPVEHTHERGAEVTPVRRQPDESLSLGLECLRVDLEQAVELRLEVVVKKSGGAKTDVRGNCRPLRVLVPVAAEVLNRCRQDLLALAAGTRRTELPAAPPGLRVLGHLPLSFEVTPTLSMGTAWPPGAANPRLGGAQPHSGCARACVSIQLN